ncbi:hypothetical protein D3874_03175 [Oleomonas cavernae]|uniref:Uncharacterized protein n=1 Tax=Oleomonas cavernae TaxID=2320859 RepID=A0A418WU88_9PROT|nr:hypothetical protein [Oleomonas cavernae]RJF94830.1 hypothetical protein D3874_03175 [Oleomonas cavernae]
MRVTALDMISRDARRRLLLLAEAIGDVAQRVAAEQVSHVMRQGDAPSRAVTMLGRLAEARLPRRKAIEKLAGQWLEMVRDNPALLAPYEHEIATRQALLEAAGRPYHEVEHG